MWRVVCIVQEETSVIEDNWDKNLSDFMEIRHWLQIKDLKYPIIDKRIDTEDREQVEA